MEFNVKALRERKGWTQAELSDASGVGRITISRLESGVLKETTAGTLMKLAKALECTMNDIVKVSNAS